MQNEDKVPCKKCGGDAEITKRCGDNGSSSNGVEYRLECSVCLHNEKEWFRSSMLAIHHWETNNDVLLITSAQK